jgi:hypothetical protein
MKIESRSAVDQNHFGNSTPDWHHISRISATEYPSDVMRNGNIYSRQGLGDLHTHVYTFRFHALVSVPGGFSGLCKRD